jgi:hypothetical protein
MPATIEPASSGRATCRGCGEKIAARTLRLGDQVPNTYADDGGLTTQWYHLWCGAFRRPEPILEALAGETPDLAAAGVDRNALAHEAQLGVTHHRLPRVSTASLAPTGRATCRACKALIDKDTWRIALVYYEDGRFAPSGFIHAGCARTYLETTDILPRIRHFSPALTDEDVTALAQALGGA